MTLTVGLFHFPPFTFESDDDDDSLRGVEVTILREVASALGLAPRFLRPSDGSGDWGSLLANGTATGLIRDVVDGAVDVGAAEFFNDELRNRYADPSDFYTYDHYCFVLAKPPPAPRCGDGYGWQFGLF